MLSFAISYLAAFTIRAEMPEVGREVASAVIAAIVFALWRQPRPAIRIGKDAIVAGILGGALACLQPAAVEPERIKLAPALDAQGIVARVEGVVEPGGRVDPRGAWFRLRDGPAVRVAGLSVTPPPLARIAVVGRLDATRSNLAAASPAAVEILEDGPLLAPARLFEWLRQLCRERIRAACPAGTARVLLPLLIGDTGLPEDFRDELARTGTLHVIAVSGTHLSLFLAGLRIFTRRLRVLVPMLIVYAGMCAFQPPVLRSLVLCIGFLCGRRLGRALPQGSHFLMSAVVVLACDPAAFFDAGFHLSFSAFGGLIALGARRDPRDPFDDAREPSARKRLLRFLGPAARAGGGATLATAPAMIWRFNRISPVGVPATILLAPFIPVLLWLGALIVLFPSVTAFPRLATALIDLLILITGWISALPFASLDIPRPHASAVALFAGVILAIALSATKSWSGIRIASVATCVLLVLVPDRASPGIYQLMAGRGAATLLVSRDAAALVDAGPESARACEQVLKLGIRSLDLVALSHEHADHTGGIQQILARLHVGQVVVGPSFGPLAERVGGPGTSVWTAGARFEKGGLRMLALWPPEDFAGQDNDRSLVIEASVDGLRALLPGDIETEGLRTLLRTRTLDRADVVLLPHHGSENAALADLLLRTRPRTVLLSNHAGGPAEETLRLLGILPVEVRATYCEGLVAIPAEDGSR